MRVLLTGATGRLGREITRLLDLPNYKLALNARNKSKLDSLVNSLAHCNDAVTLDKDVTELSSLYEIMDMVNSHFHGLDVLINNVAHFNFGPVLDKSPEQLQTVIQTNLISVILLTRLALPSLIASGKGIIINIASIAAQHHLADAAAYCASKSGLLAFSGSLFEEVRHLGVKVCTISPGQFTLSQPRVENTITPEEIAQMVNYLLHYPGMNGFPQEITLQGL